MQKQPVIFSRRLCVLNAEDSNRTIDILINTPGGCINSGMLIYDVIQASKAPVRTFCIGEHILWVLFCFHAGTMEDISFRMEK